MRITTGWSLNGPTAANAVTAEWPPSLIDALLWSGWRHDGDPARVPCLAIKARPPTAAEASRVVDA
jgi:hypothetical protein